MSGTATRRNLLTAAAATVLLPGAVATKGVHPDADLIASCTEFLRVQWAFERHYDAIVDAGGDGDDADWSILDPTLDLVDRIVALRATTADGHLARGRCLAFHFLPQHRGCKDDPDAAPDDRFKAAMLRDLVAMERGAAA